jgi:cation transporter-like permease
VAETQITRTYRLTIRAMLAGVVMLAGAVAAFVAKAPGLGVVFLALMLACCVTGFVCAVIFRNRAVALARAVRREQRAGGPASTRDAL